MKLEKGMQRSVKTVVDESNVASAVGSGLLSVFATPAMVAQMESAAAACIQPALVEGQASVGSCVVAEHTAATLPGATVTATATITELDGRRVEFAVVACDEAGEIGRGTHTRYIVDTERFLQKAQARKKEG